MYLYRVLGPADKSQIEQVIELGDKNKKTLGFMPRIAFLERWHKGHIFVCLEDDTVIAYILFWPRSRESICTINHVCVLPNKRNQSIAKRLVNEFINSYSGYQQIRLSCRNDYLLNHFWQSLGFEIYNYTQGKEIGQYSILYKYSFHNSKDLLDIIVNNDNRVNVLLDDSIVFAINIDEAFNNITNCLFTLSSEIKYWIAPILHDDFAKQKNDIVKQNTLKQIKLFPTLPVNEVKEKQLYQEIKTSFSNLRDSDIKQLCAAISNDVNMFVTNDRQILSLSDRFNEKFDIRVFSLSEFYKNIYYILNIYQLKNFMLPSGIVKLVEEYFSEKKLVSSYLDSSRGEKKNVFLENLILSPETSVRKLCIKNSEIGIIIYEINERVLIIKLMRFLRKIKKAINSYKCYAAHCAEELIKLALNHNLVKIKIIDKNADTGFIWACSMLGFINGEKILPRYLGPSDKFDYSLIDTSCKPLSPYNLSNSINNVAQLDYIDSIFFPAKFTDINLPCFIVPIQTKWAEKLISPSLIKQHYLISDSKSNTHMYMENVYFCNTNARINAPGRILWYVTTEKATGKIFACSFLNDVIEGNGIELFKKYKKFGVYEKRDAIKLSDRSKALIFSRTEIFPHTIRYVDIKTIIKDSEKKGITLASVFPITINTFFKIYSLGMNYHHHG